MKQSGSIGSFSRHVFLVSAGLPLIVDIYTYFIKRTKMKKCRKNQGFRGDHFSRMRELFLLSRQNISNFNGLLSFVVISCASQGNNRFPKSLRVISLSPMFFSIDRYDILLKV
jgi:hypothetical protein